MPLKRRRTSDEVICIDLTTESEDDQEVPQEIVSKKSKPLGQSAAGPLHLAEGTQKPRDETNVGTGSFPLFDVDGLEIVEPDAEGTAQGTTTAPIHPNSVADDDPMRIRCRKCHHSSKRGKGTEADYCSNCGRVASEVYFDRTPKAKKYKRDASHVLLGTRTISFEIATRDPRAISKYARYWMGADSAKKEREYSQEEMDFDAFRHKLCKRPTLSTVRNLLAEGRGNENKDTVRIRSETEECILRGLECFSHFQIEASWNKSNRSGTFTVSVYLEQSLFSGSRAGADLTAFLGAWFDIFPMRVSDLCWRMALDESPILPGGWLQKNNTDLSDSEHAAWKEKLIREMKDFKAAQEENKHHLKMLCSSGNQQDGHAGKIDVEFSNVLKRYFIEQLRYQPIKLSECDLVDVLQNRHCARFSRAIGTVLGRKGITFLHLFLRYQPSSASGLEQIMTHLENVGHPKMDIVEGLNVELMDFQLQTLSWAFERETTVHGIQQNFWAQLPDDASRGDTSLFFNPILGRFRSRQPEVVRGGFIAEEMGLGKTVITLALILKNPAPETPVSGRPSSDLVHCPSNSAWKETPHQEVKDQRGTIHSRGTLVICPVSLVGQWIEEAKSKLADPVGVYPYHGQNRQRNPRRLAEHPIVVTTYQVLASDATRHTETAEGASYPPLEQIRWWRIVCDEGHELRDAQTKKSRAILNLVGDHKWLVSGTPMTTSCNDLVTQLKFLGIEHTDRTIRHLGGNRKVARFYPPRFPELQFLLGSLAMRHGQNQKYIQTGSALLALPRKKERTIKIVMSTAEKTVYLPLEHRAKAFYRDFLSRNSKKATKNSVRLFQKLVPLRVACSSGTCLSSHDEGARDQSASKPNSQNGANEYESVFKSKFDVLVAELKKIRSNHPSDKSLVFSQFLSSLKRLQLELPTHGFQYRTLSGSMPMKKRAQALRDFHSDPPTTIFLLSIRSGAVGINLTQANRVFLLEPSLNPVLESQIIGRVHRIGQKRRVEIVRLILKDSIESRLMKYRKMARNRNTTDEESEHQGNLVDDTIPQMELDSESKIPGNLSSERCELTTADIGLLFGFERMEVEQV